MKGKSVWKRMMAMLLSLAMILTSTGFATLDAKGSWYDSTENVDDDGVAFGLIFRRVWKNGNVWECEEWGEYRDRVYMPGDMFEVAYRATPDSEPIPVSANDLQITYYSDEVVGNGDPRFDLAENVIGADVPFDTVDGETSIINLYPDAPGWCVLSLMDLQAYDPDFQSVSDDNVNYAFEKTISGNYKNWDDHDPREDRYINDLEVMAAMRFVYPGAGFYDSNGAFLSDNYEVNVDYNSENYDDGLYIKIDEGNWEPYSDATDVFDQYAGEDAGKLDTSNDGQLVVEEDGYRTYGDLKNGASVGDYFTVKAQEEPGVYKLVFDPKTRHREYSIRVNYRNKADTNWRENYNVQMRIVPQPYNAMYPCWINWYDDEYAAEEGLTGPMFLDNGAPAQYQCDENGYYQYDAEDKRILEPRDLETQIGIDFRGADFWLGYQDVSTGDFTALTDPEELQVDYYESRDDYYSRAAAVESNLNVISPSSDAGLIRFNPNHETGFYVITYKNDDTCPAFVDVGYPGMCFYGSMEANKRNVIDSDNIKLISGNDATYDLGIYESYWDDDEKKTVYFDLDDVIVTRYVDGKEETEDASFIKNVGQLDTKGKYLFYRLGDYIDITRSPQNATFDPYVPNWYKVTLKAPEEGTYEVRFRINRMVNGKPEGTSEYFARVDVMHDQQINVYSKDTPEPNRPLWDGYTFRAIDPVGMELRFARAEMVEGKAVEVPLSEDELNSFKLYTKFKVKEKDDPEGEYYDDWLPDGELEEADPSVFEMDVLDDGRIWILPKQQNKGWVLSSDTLGYSYEFQTCQPGIGFFTSDYRPDVYYGMPEVMTEWLGDGETVYEIAGKKTTEPQAKYLWVWSDPADGYSALPDRTVLTVQGKGSSESYVLSKGDVQVGRNKIGTDRINYSGYSVKLTDQAAGDYTLVVDIDKYGKNYRWFGDIDNLARDYAQWDDGGKKEWNDRFSSMQVNVSNWNALKSVLDRTKKYTPSEEGTTMDEVPSTVSNNNLYVYWDDVSGDELHETYEYNVHVEKFDRIRVANQPSKTSYTEGDTFNKAGLKVMAYYEDAAVSPVDVTAYVKVPATALKTSDKSVMITYEGMGGTLSTSVAVNVTAKQITPATPAVNPTPEGKEVEVASGGSTNSEYKVTESGSSSESGAVVYEGEKTDTATNVTIPDTIKGKDGVVYKVTEIADGAMKGNAKVTNVTIGANVEVIGAGAFEGASNLKNVTAGANVTTIKKNAFNKCAKMTSFKAKGSKITTIGDGAFQGTKKMKTADFSKQKLKKIGKNAFSGSGVTKIKINANTLKTVGKGALKNAGNKKKVTVTLYAKDKKTYNNAVKKLKKGKGSAKLTFKFKKKK